MSDGKRITTDQLMEKMSNYSMSEQNTKKIQRGLNSILKGLLKPLIRKAPKDQHAKAMFMLLFWKKVAQIAGVEMGKIVSMITEE